MCMERMGLQQELYSSCFTASPVRGRSEQSTPSVSPLLSQPSFSPLSSQPSQFHSCEETVINDDLSDYHESEAPLASLSSSPPPPLGTIGNPIVVSDDKDDIDSVTIFTYFSILHLLFHYLRSSLPNFLALRT
jgi:hypothetical protein